MIDLPCDVSSACIRRDIGSKMTQIVKNYANQVRVNIALVRVVRLMRDLEGRDSPPEMQLSTKCIYSSREITIAPHPRSQEVDRHCSQGEAFGIVL